MGKFLESALLFFTCFELIMLRWNWTYHIACHKYINEILHSFAWQLNVVLYTCIPAECYKHPYTRHVVINLKKKYGSWDFKVIWQTKNQFYYLNYLNTCIKLFAHPVVQFGLSISGHVSPMFNLMSLCISTSVITTVDIEKPCGLLPVITRIVAVTVFVAL
jgi:hypothetical protein